MKKKLLFVSGCFYVFVGLGQGEYSGGSAGAFGFNNSNIGRVVNLSDLSGQSLLKKYEPDISGSPFINTNWMPAKVTLSKGKEIGPLFVKLNIESNELYFVDTLGKELIALEGVVKKIDFINYYSKDSIRYIFKSGYPGIDKQGKNYFYQVLADGKIELLAKKFKYIRTTKDELSGEVSRDFIDGGVVLYVYANQEMQTFRPNKTFVVSLFKNKEHEINAFIDANKINFKKTTDLIKLFNYYNSFD